MADTYAAAYPGSTLKYNDMSLRQGGLFDCFPCAGPGNAPGTAWHTPHAEHREGKNADLSFRSFDELTLEERSDRIKTTRRMIAKSELLRIGLEHKDHWHLTLK